jgi:hypothetical protein
MPKYIPPKHKLGMLSNHDKRTGYIENDGNWTVIETADNVKIEQLKYTPFVRVRILTKYETHDEFFNNTDWLTIRYGKLTQDELITYTSYTESDIRDYLKQKAWEYKQEAKGM